jgi:hypothetical protein
MRFSRTNNKNWQLLLVGFFIGTTVLPLQAQLPNTHLYCFDLERDGDKFDFKNCKFLSAFNPYGYNNQPHWVNNNELYLSVQTPFDTAQTEIYALSFLNNVLTRVTASAESEYSPILMPDRRNFSCIRTDARNPSVQRLWSYPIDRSTAGKEILPLHRDIGYHCWLTESKLAVFSVTGGRNSLKIINTGDQSSVELATNIGRSLVRMSDGKLAFVQKATAQTWYLKTLNPNGYAQEILIQTPPNSEDFCLLPDGTFLMGSGSKLFAFHPSDALKQWREVADLARFGAFNLKRLALSRDFDKIVVVVDVLRRN